MCNVPPLAQFDFTFALPAFGNQYEMLKVTYLFSCSTQSPVSSTLLNIVQQFKQLAAHTASAVAKYAVQSLNSSVTKSILYSMETAIVGLLRFIYCFGFTFRQCNLPS